MKLEITYRPIESLIPYINNARTHGAAQIAAIAASIREFGWTNPVLVDGANGIISGHGRVLAAKKLKIREVPVIELAGLTDGQRRAYILADNQIALNAGWDAEMLAVEIEALGEMGFDIELTGFTADEIAAMTGAGQDRAPEANLSDPFTLRPTSVFNARAGWWQARKRAWLALGIKSELGRGDQAGTSARAGDNEPATYRTIGGKAGQGMNTHAAGIKQNADGTLDYGKPHRSKGGKAAPGGSARPACDYSTKQRGDGAGRPL